MYFLGYASGINLLFDDCSMVLTGFQFHPASKTRLLVATLYLLCANNACIASVVLMFSVLLRALFVFFYLEILTCSVCLKSLAALLIGSLNLERDRQFSDDLSRWFETINVHHLPADGVTKRRARLDRYKKNAHFIVICVKGLSLKSVKFQIAVQHLCSSIAILF